jgi:hypothetical protein
MPSRPNLDTLHVIYISRLAPDEDHRAFAAVCRTSNARNPALGIGGVLLFDGEHFCQWLYGSADAVSRLLTTIALDQRHVDFKLLHLGGSDFTPAVSSWCSGFVAPFALDVMDSKRMGSAEVLPMFMAVLAKADLQPGLPLAQRTQLGDAASSHPLSLSQ